MIGDPLVMLSEKQGAPQRSYRVGDSVGEFKIAAIAPNFLELDWQGQKRGYALEDLRSKAAPPPDSGPAPVAAPVAQQQSAVSSLGAKAEGPGINVSPTMKACIPGDTAPEGTVAGGYKKMNTATPFGNQCRWEKVN